jgi:hypothetical protein
MKAALRAIGLLVDPAREWQWIDKETGDVAYLLAYYVAPLALIPALCGFFGRSLIGVVTADGSVMRQPAVEGLLDALLGYVAAFAIVMLVGLLIALLAPRFGGRRNFTGAFKLSAYSFTPVWLAGIGLLLHGLHFLALAGFYGAYLLLRGLPQLMKLPTPRPHAYAAAIVAFAGVLMVLTVAAQRALLAPAGI